MKKLYIVFLVWITALHDAHSALVNRPELNSALSWPTKKSTTPASEGWLFSGFMDFFGGVAYYLLLFFLIFGGIYLIFKTIRLAFELWYTKNLRYLKITLPRSDSKLDKEKETKKDFKEKIGIMSMFYKAIHKLSEAGLRDTMLN